MKNVKNRFGTPGLLTYGLFFTGLCLVMLSALGSEVFKWSELINAFIRDIGLLLSAVMAGTLVHEKFLRDEMLVDISDGLEDKLNAKIPDYREFSDLIADKVHHLFSSRPPDLKGIRFVNDVRRNYQGYYRWVIEEHEQELFFAGRSVLHRIDADIRSRADGYVEDFILKRLKNGCTITILFVDPQLDIIERLAREEGQNYKDLLGDIAVSLGICKRLYALINLNYLELKTTANLFIRAYNRIPYFAYHKQNDEVLVGFYFQSGLGSTSALYELLDTKTKDIFSDHFKTISNEATPILEFNGARGGRPNFNQDFFDSAYNFIENKLGQQRAVELLNRNKPTNT
jgi:hypothetical protein